METAAKKLDYQQLIWDFIGIAWRRKFWVLIPLVLGIAASIYLSSVLPRIYQSRTFILVEQQKVPQSIVKSAVTGTAQDRLSSIKQQVLSRSFLTRIIDKFGLYQQGEPSILQKITGKTDEAIPLSTGSKVKRMRASIQVETNGRRRLESFSISFMGREPETVMNVTNELASLIIEENLKIREAFIEGATDFLEGELTTLKKKLETQEKRIGDYKRTHIGELPEQLDANLRALDRFQSNLETIRLSKKAESDRIIDLERMYKVVQAQGNTTTLLDHSIGQLKPIPLSPLQQQLNQFRAALSDLLIEYNETYPDVILVRRKIKDLESQITKPVASASQGTGTSIAQSGGESPSVTNSEPAMALLNQIRNANNALRDLEKREKGLLSQITRYERRVENTPKREQEMVTIQRDYNNISASYQSLLSKKLNAEISENLEKRQKGEQFRIIDTANLPEKPIKPDKMMIVLMGSALGLGLGVGLAFIREQLDNSIRKPEEVERITSVLVLAIIPDFEDELRKNEKQLQDKVVDIESGRKRYSRRGGANR